MLQYLKKSYRTVFLIPAIDNKRIDGANDTAKLPVHTTATYSLVTRATKISNAQKQPPDEKLVLSQCGINRTIQIHQSCVIIWFCHIQLNNCVFLQQSSAAGVHWQYFSFVFGISQSSHVSLVTTQTKVRSSRRSSVVTIIATLRWASCGPAQDHTSTGRPAQGCDYCN